MTPKKRIEYHLSISAKDAVKHAPDYIWLDEDMMTDRGFCTDCEAICQEEDIAYEDCPAGWDMRDKACARHHQCEEIFEIINVLNAKIDEICYHRNNSVVIGKWNLKN